MFFIFDCYGQIVGNPDGYRTAKGATRQAELKGSRAFRAIWQRYYEAKAANPDHTRIYSVEAWPSPEEALSGWTAR